jgi:hypothetical protein
VDTLLCVYPDFPLAETGLKGVQEEATTGSGFLERIALSSAKVDRVVWGWRGIFAVYTEYRRGARILFS